MKAKGIPAIPLVALALAAITFSLAVRAQAQTETILHNFTAKATGGNPYGGLLLDAAGNLYGATADGGKPTDCNGFGCGVVYRLSLSNGHWQDTVLRNLPGSQGGSEASLIQDAAGNLYGTTLFGGSATPCVDYGDPGCGTVFKLSPTASGQWTRTVLHAFTGGADGGLPYASLVFDAAGNLYGTTGFGGDNTGVCPEGCGLVFKLSPASGGAWTETVLYNFTCGADGCDPENALTFDAAGNLYSTAVFSSPGFGVVFELSPTSSGPWTKTVLWTFAGGTDGTNPLSGLIFDPAGNLYGTAMSGGNLADCNKAGCGQVFELSPSSSGWTKSTVYNFTAGHDGQQPITGVVRDSAGNLYGTTQSGGGHTAGMVFELSPGSGGTWTEKILHDFTGGTGDGSLPGRSPLILDSAGNVYGTTRIGGTFNAGVVFEITL